MLNKQLSALPMSGEAKYLVCITVGQLLTGMAYALQPNNMHLGFAIICGTLFTAHWWTRERLKYRGTYPERPD